MIQIDTGLHSSEKDHTVMTGGTLKVDKKISSDAPIQLFQYTIPLFQNPGLVNTTEFHKGVHTNEHLLAYSPDTGSVRASISELIDGFNGKMILDVSPISTRR